MLKRLTAPLVALAVSGCGGAGYLVENYSSIDKSEIAMAEDTYWVFDKPAESRMAVSTSPGAAFAIGTAQAMTLYTVNANPDAVRFEAAATAYLAKSGRPNCRPSASQFITTPYYEVRYQCDDASPGSPSIARPVNTSPRRSATSR